MISKEICYPDIRVDVYRGNGLCGGGGYLYCKDQYGMVLTHLPTGTKVQGFWNPGEGLKLREVLLKELQEKIKHV